MALLVNLGNINKWYGNNKVLTNINLIINNGDKIAILGANGQGKTTLIELISQIQTPTKGTINYNFNSKNIKAEIGIQLQENNWPANLTIKHILNFYKSVYPNITQIKINELLTTLQLNNIYHKKLQLFSPGQKQRFNLLLALVHSPQLLILDELTSGLDLPLQKIIINHISNLSPEQTLLLVSHNLTEIEMLCNRIIVLKDSSIVYDNTLKTTLIKYENLNEFISKVL
ncbi:ABC transporter ATP-binding protein [Spiroplasma sp. AdecLV25b]|uniref:ABC transporter ATP-binding protein n=1 Tax=Spiroplasma sp. AdecLV25b TaxID=3027162 RepID=UPI0027E1CFCB|nr:ABC transporter ATP-binding protein [Spiroplasma sp. AdecLV25b]